MHEPKKVILVVDDDPDIVDTLKIVLEGAGYDVDTAPSAEQGLRAFRHRRPDLVVVDLMMEEIDSGTSFVRDLQLLANTAPVYMLTAVGDALHSTVDTSALGLTGVFQKPVDHERLLATLEAKLGR